MRGGGGDGGTFHRRGIFRRDRGITGRQRGEVWREPGRGSGWKGLKGRAKSNRVRGEEEERVTGTGEGSKRE